MKQSKEEYDTLKGRVKVVAGELKERRIECRTLQSEADILKANNSELQDRITHLEGVGMDMNKSTKETEEEVNTLKGKLIDQAKHLELAQAAIEAEKRKGDEALSAYKKKAQQSLAVANARTASAVQAKEEAELEARAARSTADIAMQRAMAAEHNGKEALAEAQGYVSEMKEQVENYNDVKRNFEGARNGLNQAKLDAEAYSKNSEILKCDLLSCQGRLEAEQRTCQDVRDTLCQAETHSNELYEETERLRKEIQRLKDEVGRLHKNRGDEEENPINNTVEDKEKNPRASVIPAEAKHTAEAEATISILQQELQDANQAIKELKETLKSAVEEQAQSEAPTSNGDSSSSIPLFYAMEKQAELMQARNEIARLANLLGNNESSKQEALDAMESMNLNLEETRAKLKRQEESQKRTPEQEKVNLEYLKNIVLSYLNAKTVQEKKALLPVMGTVLCWTPEETRQAMETLEKGGRVVDTVSTSLLGKLGL